MRTEVVKDSVLPVALVATGFARTLVRQLRTLFECAEWQSGKLESARKSLENARSIRAMNDLAAQRAGSRNFPTFGHLYESAMRNARRDLGGWRSVFGSAELRLSRTLAGIDAALDGMTERGCRSVLKRLIDDHEPTRFTGCEPTAWEVFPAAHLARSVLFQLKDITETTAPAVETGENEELNIESELNLSGGAVESVLRILGSVAELDRLDVELRRDETALGELLDQIEPNDNLQFLECRRAELVVGFGMWPGGSVARSPAKASGQTPEAASFMREILKRVVPHLRALGADLDATTPMNISTWLVEWLSARPDAATLPGDPFAFFAEGFRRFAAEFRESVRPAETTDEKPDGGGKNRNIESPADPNRKPLRKCVRLAYKAATLAETVAEETLKDADAHERLRNDTATIDALGKDCDFEEYEVPDLKTFRRYLTDARAFHDCPRKMPKGDRTGRSLVRLDGSRSDQ
jgi:hypothetical protein